MKPRESHDHPTRSKSFYKEPLHLSGIVVPIRTRSKTLVIERIIQQHSPTKNQTHRDYEPRVQNTWDRNNHSTAFPNQESNTHRDDEPHVPIRIKRKIMIYKRGCPSLGDSFSWDRYPCCWTPLLLSSSTLWVTRKPWSSIPSLQINHHSDKMPPHSPGRF